MSIIEKIKRNQAERSQKNVEQQACELFQIMEFEGELWLTYNNALVCPCGMLNAAPVEAVRSMRELFVKRIKG